MINLSEGFDADPEDFRGDEVKWKTGKKFHTSMENLQAEGFVIKEVTCTDCELIFNLALDPEVLNNPDVAKRTVICPCCGCEIEL